ncbi:MAG: hypothetical protein Q4D90_09630 [bacterium]|nr:hypothetical protein [bacterium]
MLSSITSLASTAENKTSVDWNNYQQKIIEEVRELTGIVDGSVEIVTLDNKTRMGSIVEETAIKISENGKDTFIIPKIVEDTEVINSFQYAIQALRRRDNSWKLTHLVDMTVNFTCYYNQRYDFSSGTLYTPKGVAFSWTSNNSTASINNIKIKFSTNGDYWKLSPLTSMGYEKYTEFVIEKNNPGKGVTYKNTNNAMNSNYAIVCTLADIEGHGGNLWYEMTYTVNGNSIYDDYSFLVFSK